MHVQLSIAHSFCCNLCADIVSHAVVWDCVWPKLPSSNALPGMTALESRCVVLHFGFSSNIYTYSGEFWVCAYLVTLYTQQHI